MATILIVEDNKNTAMAVAYGLWNAGHKVDLVETGGAALKMVENSLPDLILLDYSLPDTDGFSVLRSLRRDHPEVLVVIMTGKGNEELAVKMLKEGAADYLVKSSGTIETLPHTVERVLEDHRIKRQLREKDEALRQAYNNLEKKVLERTRELTEANKRLEWELAVNSARDRVAKVILTGIENIEAITCLVLEEAMALTLSGSGYAGTVESPGKNLVIHSPWEFLPNNFKLETDGDLLVLNPDENSEYPPLLGESLNTGKSFFSNTARVVDRPTTWGGNTMLLDRFLSVPAVVKGQAQGLICLADPSEDYTDREVWAVERLADLLALALDGKRAEKEKIEMESRLLQAQKMEAIGALAGGIAHDFNNVLWAIEGFAEICMFENTNALKIRQNLTNVVEAARRARELIKRIMIFCRRSDEEKQSLRPASIIKETLQLLRASLPASIEIHSDLETSLGYILANPTQIHQVVMNLCTNAGQAMAEKGGRLKVTLRDEIVNQEFAAIHPGMEAGPYVIMELADTGPGVPQAMMDRIFEPYFTTKEAGVGTGLGLSVVHGIVKNHQGVIMVESPSGGGATFRVYLPIMEHPSVRIEEKASIEPPKGSERILFVDDEPALIDVGQQMLEHMGYKVVTRNDSRQALAEFRERPDDYDLIITDHNMPHLTGVDLARKIKKVKPEIPIVLFSGYAETITMEEADSIGINAVLLKPVSFSELAAEIRGVLDRKGRGAGV